MRRSRENIQQYYTWLYNLTRVISEWNGNVSFRLGQDFNMNEQYEFKVEFTRMMRIKYKCIG